MTDTDRVILRRWRDTKDLIALLPDAPANPGRVMSYMHVGQHAEANRDIVYHTDPVREEHGSLPADAHDLIQELVAIGYMLVIRKRLPPVRSASRWGSK